MARLFIFGLGYTAKRIKAAVEELGWQVDATGSDGNIEFGDGEAVKTALCTSSHILSSVPPDRASGLDPVLERYGAVLGTASFIITVPVLIMKSMILYQCGQHTELFQSSLICA